MRKAKHGRHIFLVAEIMAGIHMATMSERKEM